MPTPPTGRRPLLKAVAGGVVALGAVGVTARLTSSDSHGGPRGTLTLSSDGGSDVAALEIRLGDGLLPQHAARRWRSAHLPTTTHSMVAFTWHDPTLDPRIEISSRQDGAWGPWQRVPHLHDLPDVGSGEGTATAGTDLLWIGASDGIQVRVHHDRPDDLTLVLLHPAPRATDAHVEARPLGGSSGLLGRRTTRQVPAPAVISRKTWGADESWRNGGPRYNATIQQVHVHHTVSVNNYAPADVPALIRGMYRYHTHNLGWSDIGYNFLVDRFGRAWEGRFGGITRPVRGAHTLGFNATSTGISNIGNFDLVAPTDAMLTTIAALAAWKLDLYHRTALGTTTVRSEGSDKFRPGRVVTLPVIDGHRDTNDTACPGQKLYTAIPVVRSRAAALLTKYHQPAATPVRFTVAPTVTGTPRLGQTLTVGGAAVSPATAVLGYAWRRDGVALPGATAATYHPVSDDVGHRLSVVVTAAQSGYQPATAALDAGSVTAATTTTVSAVGGKGNILVHVTVAAAGYSGFPDGPVVVAIGKRRRTLTLADGRASARFVHFTGSRPHGVSVSYPGNATMLPSRASTAATTT